MVKREKKFASIATSHRLLERPPAGVARVVREYVAHGCAAQQLPIVEFVDDLAELVRVQIDRQVE